MRKEENYVSDNINTCFFGNFPPKECGIATFTRDLSKAMDKKFNPKLKSQVIALNERGCLYNYNKQVIFQIDKEDISEYIDVAKKINESPKIKIISVQHEFGIFGGEYGNYIISFLETLKKPCVITFHSVLPKPEEERKKVVRAIASRCSAIIVMAKTAKIILKDDYEIEDNKIYVIHHGVPNVELKKNLCLKEKLEIKNRIVISTFGLLSRGKGIEYMIKALPKLVKEYPDILYVVLGQTHPNVIKKEGEKYRKELMELIDELGIKNNVKFYNKYLSLNEIIEFLQASDIYVCTNLEKNQITSGTLAYALGCGKAVISTPSIYAEEILKDDRGVLVGFRNPDSYVKAINSILSDDKYKDFLEKNAYSFSRSMIWSNVAINYLKVFNKVVKLRDEIVEKFPKIKLDHLINLTDDFGIIQFAKHNKSDKLSGYTLDDNSRGLIIAVLHNNLFNSEISMSLSKKYLKFIENSQEGDGNFKNNYKNENEFTKPYSEDSFGRAIWALAYTIFNSKNEELVKKTESIFNKSINRIESLNSPRAKSFALNGLYYYYKFKKEQEILDKIKKLADDLVKLYNSQSTEDWHWFEPYLTYSNANLSEALFLAYEITNDKKYLEIAEKTLGFLSELCIIDGKLSPIGQNGWCNRGNERAFFDQQPVDASSIVHAYLTAFYNTKQKNYYDKAVLAFNWFLGNNHLNQMIYDETTGGCFDGLGKHSLNLNQGAESTISYLIARLSLEEFKRNKKIFK